MNTLKVASEVITPKKRTTSHELWSAIERHCAISSKPQIQVIKKMMLTTRKGYLKMCEYLAKMKELADELVIASAPLSNGDLIFNALLGFEANYLSMTTVLQRQVDLDW
ncbi:hypothetical protein Scep_004521 [Stephania cephalantha]|uniref:Uncharacterized protein n=1 Tax=Stephania cephalantha TaxID=152367 RepID=A0AAP0KSL6_9MAGN